MAGLPSRAWRLGERDWTRPFGITIDRSQIPPDDEFTDVAAWLAGRFDTLAATELDLDGHAPRCDGWHHPISGHCGDCGCFTCLAER